VDGQKTRQYKEKHMTLTQTDVLAGLAEVLEEVSGVPADKVVPTATFENDLEVDSLTMVEVVVACEERFGVRIPDEALENLRTVGDAVDYITTAGIPA
jgi:acyl carrier protein